MIIKNYKELATTKSREQILAIVEAGIKAVEPRNMLSNLVSYNEDFNSIKIYNKAYDVLKGRIFVIGGGKASGAMAEALERIVGSDHITDGVVAVKEKGYKTKNIKLIKAGHPYPDWRSVRASKKILAFKDKYQINEHDLVISLISGGASAMLASPVDAISLKDKQRTTRLLLESGAKISDINVVRKHLSKIKGGQLASFFYPARVVSLVISDVLGDKLEVIGSGPTVSDPSTFNDALFLLEKYAILDKVPQKVRHYIERGTNNESTETPKQLTNADNYIIGSNKSSLESMAHKAQSLGLRPIIVDSEVKGDPTVMAYKIVRNIMRNEFENYDVLLFAGETNPKLPEKYGKGGRNQQFSAASMLALSHLEGPWTHASVSTDGIDYDLSVAGAIVDNTSLKACEKAGINPAPFVRGFDTYNLFKKMGNSHIHTGSTGTNVADIMVYKIN